MANATLNRSAIVAQFSARVVNVATYVSACGAIDGLVTAGQVAQNDASGAKADLATVMATAIAASAASAKSGAPTYKASPAGGVHFRGTPGASIQYGITLFPAMLAYLFANREAIENFVADGLKAGTLSSGSTADRIKFGAAKEANKAAYEAKKAAKAKTV